MRSTLLISLLTTATLALPTVQDSPLEIAKAIVSRAPPEAKAVLKSVSSTGTGCAPNSAAFIIADDATLAFDSMVVDSSMTELTKRCLVTVDLSLDPKWKYTVNAKGTTIRGWADQAVAKFRAEYKSVATGDITGSKIKGTEYVLTSKEDAGATSACSGGVATLNNSIRLYPEANKTSIITVDSVDITFSYAKC
ncbi:hypothetical protein K469DRAFT_745680 [Zopfia rhizophila CBS 207.26]|uniref:Secreted protein n=1 Tax=Zopfia rhizophila CBS 207.26 TaxID=1314779 RepID=A0A6A6EKN3_9PEZI|nr:hypothetical protein K469DRAFT_745680 [Zopfia rhizophila CBS 207.26]